MPEARFEFSLGEHGDATVKGWDGLEKWLERERAQWSWLLRGDGKTDAHNWASSIQSQWDTLINNVHNLHAQGQEIETARPHLQPLAGGALLAAESPDGALILEIREAAGDVAASFAYAFIKGGVSLTNARNREELLGAILTVIPDMREPADLSARLQRERANYRSGIKSAIERIDRANEERAEHFEETLGRGKTIAAHLLRRRRDNWRRVQDAWQEQATQAVSEIKGVEAAYLEAMRLQAPVAYWEGKAEAHRKKEVRGIWRLAIYFPVALLGLGWAFWESGTYLLERATTAGTETPAALYIIITGGLAVLSTILFWIGRLFTKLYLSEHHLRNDASERAIMTQTYLALTKEAAATDADRNIVLTAIFRNTPDGIVKDEGPGDLTLQALASRLLTK